MKKLLLVLLLFLAVPTIYPLLQSGYYPMHDDTQPSRVYQMKKVLQEGIFPVRWVPDLGYGYGYPLFNFYGPFAYYIGGFISLFTVNAIVATKIMIGIGVLLPGVSMYLLARQFWGEWGGMISALLYVYAPYHAVNIYVRGAVAELFAYGWIPFVFLALYKIYLYGSEEQSSHKNEKAKNDQKNYIIWQWIAIGAVSYAAIITSHNLTAMMVTPFILFFALIAFIFSFNKLFVLRSLFFSLVCGILLAAFYWLPVLSEMKYTNVSSVVEGTSFYGVNFVCPIQLWDSPWGYGGSAAGCVDGMSFRLGKIHILLSLIALLAVPFLWKKNGRYGWVIALVLFSALFCAFLTTEGSQFIWEMIRPMSFFQFPWRFLLMLSFFTSFVGGSFMWMISNVEIKSKLHIWIVVLLLLGFVSSIIFLYSKLFKPQYISQKSEKEYTSELSLKWKISKISDEYMPKGFQKPQTEADINTTSVKNIQEDSVLTIVNTSSHYINATLANTQKDTVIFPIAYFPAWKFFINGKEQQPVIKNTGVELTVPPGNHVVEALFMQTPIELLGNMLSVASIVALCAGIIQSRRSYNSKNKIT